MGFGAEVKSGVVHDKPYSLHADTLTLQMVVAAAAAAEFRSCCAVALIFITSLSTAAAVFVCNISI